METPLKVLSMNLKGTVSSHPDSKGFLFVQMGIIRSKVHISDLELVDEPVINTPGLPGTGAGKIRMSKSTSVSTEINLLGKTVDEAVAELDKYLDDAYLAHLKSVRIVHGKGTGALRKEYTIISAARSMWQISTWLNLAKEMLVLPL